MLEKKAVHDRIVRLKNRKQQMHSSLNIPDHNPFAYQPKNSDQGVTTRNSWDQEDEGIDEQIRLYDRL